MPEMLRELHAAGPAVYGIRKLLMLLKWRLKKMGVDVPKEAKPRETSRDFIVNLWKRMQPTGEDLRQVADDLQGELDGSAAATAADYGEDDPGGAADATDDDDDEDACDLDEDDEAAEVASDAHARRVALALVATAAAAARPTPG